MTNNEEALKLVQECLDDWPYAATRVVDIMTRLEKVKELLKEEAAEVVEEERRVLWDETDDGPIYTQDVFYHCPSCNLILSRTHKDKDINFCKNCGRAVKWE